MPTPTPQTLNHYALFKFTDAYRALSAEARATCRREWLAGLRAAAAQVHVYQCYPAQADADLLVWSALPAEAPDAAAHFFTSFARATNPQRSLLAPSEVLWGYTRPSQYTRTRSVREIDAFTEARQRYLIVYPFTKTSAWYLLDRETRQTLMTEHIRIGKQYDDVTQLLLYSFGVQDQEFVVVYETDDLLRFSDLVNALRATDVRGYTLRDSPLHVGVYHPAEDTLALWA